VTGGTATLDQLLPERADNAYREHRLALALFALLLLMKAGISLGPIFNGHTAASSADGIPIDTYTPAGARTVVSLFAVLGLANLVVCVMGAVVLFRYRGLIPFMFALLLA
jgi:TRAP-type C4-dicarboxylate transport system permease small subunit